MRVSDRMIGFYLGWSYGEVGAKGGVEKVRAEGFLVHADGARAIRMRRVARALAARMSKKTSFAPVGMGGIQHAAAPDSNANSGAGDLARRGGQGGPGGQPCRCGRADSHAAAANDWTVRKADCRAAELSSRRRWINSATVAGSDVVRVKG